jgi:EPS-associated MarR family transcriptional regulator
LKKRINHSEIELEILRNIEANPHLTQRQIAKDLGVSLGKTNYLIQALLGKGFLMINNFKRSDNKLGYLYLLTPEGIEKKRKLTILFLQRKSEEFDKLKKEMERIKIS